MDSVDGSSDTLASTTVPLQTDLTVGIAALVIVAMTAFAIVLLYLAFGPHNRRLEDAVAVNGSSRAAADESEREADADDSVGLESETSTSSGAGGSESLEEG